MSWPVIALATAASPKSMMQKLAAAVDHDVRGLQVAVQDALLVRGGECGTQTTSELEGLVAGSRPMRRRSDARSSPSTYSIEMNVAPSISPRS